MLWNQTAAFTRLSSFNEEEMARRYPEGVVSSATAASAALPVSHPPVKEGAAAGVPRWHSRFKEYTTGYTFLHMYM